MCFPGGLVVGCWPQVPQCYLQEQQQVQGSQYSNIRKKERQKNTPSGVFVSSTPYFTSVHFQGFV
jgi:hypothetical protein